MEGKKCLQAMYNTNKQTKNYYRNTVMIFATVDCDDESKNHIDDDDDNYEWTKIDFRLFLRNESNEKKIQCLDTIDKIHSFIICSNVRWCLMMMMRCGNLFFFLSTKKRFLWVSFIYMSLLLVFHLCHHYHQWLSSLFLVIKKNFFFNFYSQT